MAAGDPVPGGAAAPAQLVLQPDGKWRVNGALTFATARRAARQGVLALGAQRLSGNTMVDCSGIGDCDSAGLAVLIDWMAHARAAGGTLRYNALPARLLALARISEVEEILCGQPAAG
ncbi:MAG: STAS domain-containing protein [Proteobacteria bacterium]|nr:STAS domain-containing protein [Pseudomonadota bacterium]